MKRSTVLSMIVIIIYSFIFCPGCKEQKKDEEKIIKIGAILVLTGPYANAGQSAKQGIDLALEEINSKSGIENKKIKIIFEDDQGEPQKAVSAIQKLISVDKVTAIIGPMPSSNVLAVAPIAEKNKMVILSPSASNPRISDAGDYIFRNTYSDALEGKKIAKYAFKELGYKKVSIFYINNDYGLGLKEAFKKEFEINGGEISQLEAYDPKEVDFKPMLTKTVNKSADAFYITGYNEMGNILKQAKELGINKPVLSCIMFEIADIAKVAGAAAEGVIYSYPSFDPQKGSTKTKEFTKRFQKKYGVLPSVESAFAFDAFEILILAIEKGGLNSDGIKNALYNIKGYEGVTGETSFDNKGDVIKRVGFKKYENGKYQWVEFEY